MAAAPHRLALRRSRSIVGLAVAVLGLQLVVAAPSSGQTSLGTLTVDNDNPVAAEPDTGQRTTLRFHVTLNRTSGPGLVNVDYRTEGGTAAIGVDYLERAGTLSFTGTQSAATVEVTVLGDNADEADETFNLVLSNPVNADLGTPASETATISDDDPLPSLRIGDISVTEGNAGEQQALFAVTLSGVTGRTATVNFTTNDGTGAPATAPADYTTTSGTLQFPPGTLTATVSVPVIGDAVDEPNENFQVVLSGEANATVADGTGVGTITDDDGPPTVSIDDASVAEGNTAMPFTVRLSAPSQKTVTLQAQITEGTATDPEDYDGTPVLRGVTFTPGQTEASLVPPVMVKQDAVQEGDHSFTVTLLPDDDAALGDATAVGTILDDDVAIISIDDVSKNEGSLVATTFTFTVTRTGAAPAPGSPISIAFATENGSASAPADYTSTNGPLTFSAGDPATKSITVPVTADTLAEGPETFAVNLSQAPGSPVFRISKAQGTGTILNDDGPPAEITVDDASVVEGTGGTKSMLFKVKVSSGFLQPVTFTYTTKDGTAVAGNDYSPAVGTIVVPSSGQETVSVSVETDALDEIDETFTVELSNVQNAVVKDGTGTGTILDDDNPPAVSVANLTLVEGGSETSARGEVPVTLSAPSGRQVTVRFDPQGGTATAGIDYAATGATLTFAPGEVDKTIVVEAKGDDIDEIDETFMLKLTNPVNATLGTATGTVTIQDDDVPPVIDLDDATADEPDAATDRGELVFEAVLSPVSGKDVTFNFATADKTPPSATAGADYESASGTVTIPAGTGGASIKVVTKGDDLDESSETMTLALSGVTNATGPAGSATGTIRDNDGTPTFSIAGTTVPEGTGADGTVTLTVTLLPAAGGAVSVDYATANGTATAGGANDYVQKNGTLNFAAGVTSQTISVTIKADNNDEVDEAFTVALSNASLSTQIDAAANPGTVGITDDDGPTVTVAGPTPVTEGSAGVTDAIFTVTLSAASVQEVRVGYATSSGTASSDSDFTPASGMLVFAPGETTKPVAVKVLGDTVPEEDETFSLGVGPALNATVATGSAAATITDDDRPGLALADAAVVEGNAGTNQASFTLTLSNPTDVALSVDYATAEGTATDPEDFVATTGKVVFAAGERKKTVSVPVVGESVEEADETFTVTISGVNATVADIQRATATGTIVDDDSAPGVKVTGLGAGGLPGSDATVTEGTGADVEAILQVSLENPRAYPVKIRYEAVSGSASVADFAAAAGELLFEPGDITKPVTLTVSGDSLDERTETFSLVLSQPDRAVLADPEGVISIVDNDKAGYFMVATDGGIFSFGDAGFYGSTGAVKLNQPIVGAAPHPSGRGYWLLAADGGIFTFGEAGFYGSTGAVKLNKPIVGMAATPSGNGYWLVATDGGIFSFGDAAFQGSTGAVKLNKPVVGMASTPSGKGYWLVATDGGIFSFGDAAFQGSTGAVKLNQPIVGMASTTTGKGYWLVATDGGIFTFGDAKFHGSTGAVKLNRPIVGMVPTPSGNGYWLVADDGGIFTFGDAEFLGSTGAVKLNKPVVGMAVL